MLRFACPKLKDLATAMRQKYDLRGKMILRNGSDAEMLKVEYDLIHIHRSIARHRRNCSHCKPYANSARPALASLGQLPGDRSFIPFDMAS
jgi:hypothetical protein